MKEHVKRMFNEITELNEKIKKLEKFFKGEEIKNVSDMGVILLQEQYHIMWSYLYVLNHRINYEIMQKNCTVEELENYTKNKKGSN